MTERCRTCVNVSKIKRDGLCATCAQPKGPNAEVIVELQKELKKLRKRVKQLEARPVAHNWINPDGAF